jgi:hypothetical protein
LVPAASDEQHAHQARLIKPLACGRPDRPIGIRFGLAYLASAITQLGQSAPSRPPTLLSALTGTRPKETRAATAAAHAEPVASPPSSRSFIGQAEDMEFIPPEPRSLTNDPVPAETHDDPLADVPLIGPVTDRFTIQPGDIEFIVVGSIEVVIHPADTDDPND